MHQQHKVDKVISRTAGYRLSEGISEQEAAPQARLNLISANQPEEDTYEESNWAVNGTNSGPPSLRSAPGLETVCATFLHPQRDVCACIASGYVVNVISRELLITTPSLGGEHRAGYGFESFASRLKVENAFLQFSKGIRLLPKRYPLAEGMRAKAQEEEGSAKALRTLITAPQQFRKLFDRISARTHNTT
ncbi:hypothetical protein Trydic_g10617 [Trypoxylus dichotomus]